MTALPVSSGSGSHSVFPPPANHTCFQCGRSFARVYILRRHEAAHRGQYPFWCKICGKGCLSTNNLRRHLATHTGARDHQCKWCSQKFTCPWSLKRHMRNFHQDKA
ncbi:hypothetical protein NP493_942g00094 [Ridgeia piscesae]|uniref:C2H2-type domain-containing protein n=1 Tax=Ridgeia piscesae TaxID=27915 RepID=A0AAD9NJU7_RIDPI|nr:hypothetical protein NP493_942g00094 [Ridgeia piscesae]